MSTEPIAVAVIVGSVRTDRFGGVVANWFTEQVKQRPDMEVDVIDLVDVPLPVTLTNQPSPETARVLDVVSPRLAAADTFVVVTPEYNHSFPASLKNVIDWHYTQWRAKPVGFVSYGGLAGGLRSVEHLRQVFAELHAITPRDTVSFHNAWNQFGTDGQPTEPEGCGAAAKTMLDELAWWGTALRDARRRNPYPSA